MISTELVNQVYQASAGLLRDQRAGAPLSNDVLKCRLKPIDPADYRATFTDAQKARLARIFPSGVCDFSKPGVEQVALKGTYQRY